MILHDVQLNLHHRHAVVVKLEFLIEDECDESIDLSINP